MFQRLSNELLTPFQRPTNAVLTLPHTPYAYARPHEAARNAIRKAIMLVKLGHDTIVSTDAIRSIVSATPHPATGRERYEVTFTNGKTLLVTCSTEQAERLTGQVVPAPLGYFVIEACPPATGEGEPTFSMFPVIAFRTMAAEHALMPITAAGEPENTWALVYPDGRCDAPWERIYDTVDDFKSEFRKTIEAQR